MAKDNEDLELHLLTKLPKEKPDTVEERCERRELIIKKMFGLYLCLWILLYFFLLLMDLSSSDD